jgi:hypothetical protein
MSFSNPQVKIYTFKHPGAPPSRPMIPECTHERMRFIWRIFDGQTGPRRYGFQCTSCGKMGEKTNSGNMKSTYVVARNVWDYFGMDYREGVSAHDTLTDNLKEVRDDFYRYKRSDLDQQHHSAWWDWYDSYLKCADWKEKRQRVFLRDGYKCAVCRGPAEQVHHLSYKNVGYEPLEDLVSICTPCHEQVHS